MANSFPSSLSRQSLVNDTRRALKFNEPFRCSHTLPSIALINENGSYEHLETVVTERCLSFKQGHYDASTSSLISSLALANRLR